MRYANRSVTRSLCAVLVAAVSLVVAPAPVSADDVAPATAPAEDVYYLGRTSRNDDVPGVSPSNAVDLWRSSSAAFGVRSLVAKVPAESLISPTMDAVAWLERAPGAVTIMVRKLDGSELRTLATIPVPRQCDSCEAASDRLGAALLDWSADGARMLLSTAATNDHPSALVVVSSVPGEPPISMGGRGGAFDPRDSRRVFLVEADADGFGPLVLAGLDGGRTLIQESKRTESVFATRIVGVTVSADGSRVAFSRWSDRTSSGSVEVLDTSDWAVRTPASLGRALPPRVSSYRLAADGEWLYYTADDAGVDASPSVTRPGDLHRIHLIEAAEPERLTSTAGVGEQLVRIREGTVDPQAPTGFSASLRGGHTVLRWEGQAKSFELRRFNGETTAGSALLRYSGIGRQFKDPVLPGRAYTYELWTVSDDGARHGPAYLHTVATNPPALRAPRLSSDAANASLLVRWDTPSNAEDTAYQVTADTYQGSEAGRRTGKTRLLLRPEVEAVTNVRVTALDRFSNESPRVSAEVLNTQEAGGSLEAAGAVPAGSWSFVPEPRAWFRSLLISRSRRARLVLSAYVYSWNAGSREIFLIGEKGPGHGQFRLYLDGRFVATVDTGAARRQHRAVLWSGIGWDEEGDHTLTVVNLATSKRPLVAIDGWARSH